METRQPGGQSPRVSGWAVWSTEQGRAWPKTWITTWATIGAGTWVGFAIADVVAGMELSALTLLLLLAILVLTPVVLSLVPVPSASHLQLRLNHLSAGVFPIAATAACISFILPVGAVAAGCAAAWLAFTVLLAAAGLVRLGRLLRLARINHAVHRSAVDWSMLGGSGLGAVCATVALLYLPVGAGWMVLASLGAQPLDFSPTTVLLTATHFHVIALAALVLTGLTGRAVRVPTGGKPRWEWHTYRVAATGVLLSPLAVAAGITQTQLTGVRVLETAASALLALSLMAISVLILRVVVSGTRSPLARILLAISGASVFVTMTLAGLYTLGAATGAWVLTIPTMIAIHGWGNAVGFGLCGLLGWRLRLATQDD